MDRDGFPFGDRLREAVGAYGLRGDDVDVPAGRCPPARPLRLLLLLLLPLPFQAADDTIHQPAPTNTARDRVARDRRLLIPFDPVSARQLSRQLIHQRTNPLPNGLPIKRVQLNNRHLIPAPLPGLLHEHGPHVGGRLVDGLAVGHDAGAGGAQLVRHEGLDGGGDGDGAGVAVGAGGEGGGEAGVAAGGDEEVEGFVGVGGGEDVREDEVADCSNGGLAWDGWYIGG
ncbi:hypothetical protein KEM55_008311 [Ascosphaera atra]|nr:hypothetical protein KEM55_008311 [Ascosphaera atra]